MTEFKLPSMTCGGCAARVTRALQAADPAVQVQVNLPQRTVQVDSQLAPETLAQALAAAGYAPVTD